MVMSLTVQNANAASVSDLVAIDNDWTFIAERYTINGTLGLTRNTLYADGKIFTPTGNSVANNKHGSRINGIERLNCLRLKNVQDRLAFKVTGACTVTFYTPSEARGIVVSKSDRTDTGDAYYAWQPNNTPVWTVELDEAGTYYLSNHDGDFYIAGFEVKYPAPTWQKIDIDLRSGQLGTEGTNMQKYLAIDGEENYTYSDVEPGSYNAILSASSFNGSDHGYVGFKAAVPVEAGVYKISLGACKFANGTGYVKNEDETSILNVVNAHGQTVNSFSQNTGFCYHQDVKSHKVCLWYTATEAETINILCDVYTPYFSIERVNAVPELKYLVIYKNEATDVEGISSLAPFEVLGAEDLIVNPLNRIWYKEGYTFAGWNDGSVTHAPGTDFAPSALTTTLTTVFEENLYDLNESVEDWTARWEFHRANGAPLIQWEGHSTPDLLVTQATLNGHTIDLPLHVTTSPGKFNNAANENTCQVNDGTILTFPTISGATVKTYSNYEPTSSTLDGNTYDSYNNHLTTYSTTNASGTSTFVNYNGRYYEYLEVTFPASEAALPLVKSVTVDGVEMGSGILAPLNFENPHSATFAGNIYTTVPVVQITYSDDATETLVASGTGTTRTYTANKTISATDYTFTLNIEGVHVYEAGANDETVQVKCPNPKPSPIDSGWTDENGYAVSGNGLDGNAGNVFKFSHMSSDKIFTLSVPSYVIVKQLVIKNWAQNYDCATPTTIISVTSTGATAIYVPTDNAAAPKSSTRDLVINLDGHVAGAPIVISMALPTQTVGWFELKVEKQNYTREHPHMNLNTLCYPYHIDSYSGATFYNILSTTVEGGNLTELVLEEHVGALDAGVPYFYDPTPGAAELVCYYSGAEVSTPGTAAGGAFVGTYVDDAPVPSGSYVTVNNQLYKTGDGATMGEYRAYVSPQAYTRAALPGRKILRIGDKGTTTAVETLLPAASCSQKILRNGQVIIIRGDKKYNMLGQEL